MLVYDWISSGVYSGPRAERVIEPFRLVRRWGDSTFYRLALDGLPQVATGMQVDHILMQERQRGDVSSLSNDDFEGVDSDAY